VNAENDRETDGYTAVDYVQSVVLRLQVHLIEATDSNPSAQLFEPSTPTTPPKGTA